MNKTIKKLLYLIFILQFFTFMPRVSAGAYDGVTFNEDNIIVKQGDTILQKENDVYIAPGYGTIKVYYTLNGYNPGSGFGSSPMVKLDDNSWGCGATFYYGSTTYNTCQPNFQHETENYVLKICDDYQCDNPYDTYEFSVNFEKYNDVQDDKVYFTNLSQGGNDLVLDEYNYFTVNTRQNAIFSITGENLDEEADYIIMCGGNSNYQETYTGAEIMNGVDYVCKTSKIGSNTVTPMYYLEVYGGYCDTVQYQTLDGLTYPSYHFVEDNTLPTYEVTLKYTNYPDIELKEVDEEYSNDKRYLVRSKYANSNNTLSYYIAGSNFQNKDYDIDLKVLNGTNSVYTREVKVNGVLLNNGYNLELTNFDLGTVTNVRYQIQITIDYVDDETNIEYIYPDKEMTITGIKQGNNTLEKENGVYIAPYTDGLEFLISIENFDPDNDYYFVKVTSESGRINEGYSYPSIYGNTISPNFDSETEELTVSLCDNYSCNNLYTYETVKVKLLLFNQLKNQKIFFYDVKQGGNTVTPNSYGGFVFNNKQDVTLKVKGENLIADREYSVSTGSFYKILLGSELEEGIEVTHNTYGSGYFNISFYLEGTTSSLNLTTYYYDGENYQGNGDNGIYFYFSFSDMSYDKSYESALKYKNYPDVEIEEADNVYRDYYIVSTEYHNNENPLSYFIQGNGYEDTDYTINIWVIKDGDERIYNHTATINGLEINQGCEITLSDFTMPLVTELDNEGGGVYGMPLYEIYVSVDYVSESVQARYNSVGRDVNLQAEIFFENGKKNLASFRGFGNSGMYDTNQDVFRKYSKIYINFLGENFNDDDEYNYILEYGRYLETDENYEVNYPTVLKTGTVSGEILNNVGLFFELRNDSNYDHPTYRLIIKKGNEILMYSAPVIYTTDMATLGSVMLSTRNKDLYLRTSDYSYIATRSMPIDIEVSGIGFEDDEEYEFEFCYNAVYGEFDYGDETCAQVLLLGEDLNDGTASIDFDEDIDENAEYYSFYVYGSDSETYFGQGGFSLSFVANSDLFPNITRYIIDDASEIIRNIRKNTTVEQFKENLGMVDGDDIKIYDKTGQTEITEKVGTGMRGILQDEYERNIISIDIAVKGDTSGDGNVSVTDLVKVKRHLANIELLDEIYKVAGDVTETGKISPTDLVRISQDVTRIMEMQ